MFECTAYFVYGIVFTVILAVFIGLACDLDCKNKDDESEPY